MLSRAEKECPCGIDRADCTYHRPELSKTLRFDGMWSAALLCTHPGTKSAAILEEVSYAGYARAVVEPGIWVPSPFGGNVMRNDMEIAFPQCGAGSSSTIQAVMLSCGARAIPVWLATYLVVSTGIRPVFRRGSLTLDASQVCFLNGVS